MVLWRIIHGSSYGIAAITPFLTPFFISKSVCRISNIYTVQYCSKHCLDTELEFKGIVHTKMKILSVFILFQHF